MDTEQVLSDMGLSDGETKVYLALLRLGPSQASKIKEATNLHRTTIYDFVEKLLNKGLLNYTIQNNVKIYKATHPNKLIDYVKEKENNVKDILPDLIKISESVKQDIRVEVYKGKEGFKSFLNDVIRTKKDVVAFGVDEKRFMDKFPVIMDQFFRREKENKIKERLLTYKSSEVYNKKNLTYKFIPKEYFSPTPTMVYGNKVVNVIWEPLTIVLIENKDLADSYRKHFELLWKQAK